MHQPGRIPKPLNPEIQTLKIMLSYSAYQWQCWPPSGLHLCTSKYQMRPSSAVEGQWDVHVSLCYLNAWFLAWVLFAAFPCNSHPKFVMGNRLRSPWRVALCHQNRSILFTDSRTHSNISAVLYQNNIYCSYTLWWRLWITIIIWTKTKMICLLLCNTGHLRAFCHRLGGVSCCRKCHMPSLLIICIGYFFKHSIQNSHIWCTGVYRHNWIAIV